MKRVLQVLDSMGYGGIQAFIMNVYRRIDRSKMQFDFLLNRKLSKSYEDEIKTLGGNIYYVTSRRNGFFRNKKELNTFFKNNNKKYSIVHFHESSMSYITPLYYAKKYNIKTRIIHCHSSAIRGFFLNKVFHYINKKKIHKLANIYISCGKKAGDWFYSGTKVFDKYIIVHNGIDINKFQYNSNVRNTILKELSLDDNFVVGHIGRFNAVKNHRFLIEIFEEVLKINPKSKLLLVGDGDLIDEIKEFTIEKQIDKNVIFLGNRTDIDQLVQAMDVLVFPSLYEGYPLTIIEASASGLPVVMSDTITNEVVLKGNIFQLPLQNEPVVWAKKVTSNLCRENDNKVLFDNGLDISYIANQMIKIYANEEN